MEDGADAANLTCRGDPEGVPHRLLTFGHALIPGAPERNLLERELLLSIVFRAFGAIAWLP